MSPDTADPPKTSPEKSCSFEQTPNKPFGIANSFVDSQQRRNRRTATQPTQASQNQADANRQATPTPLPKRPKGRFFVGSFLICMLLGFVYAIWSAFFSVVAHGIVEGRKLEITPFETSVIRTIHVRDGAFVKQGDPLFTLESLEPKPIIQNDAAEDLANAIYDLDVEVARLRVNASLKDDPSSRAFADYYQLWGEFLKEQIKLDELIDKFRRGQQLSQRNSIGAANLRTSEFDVKGQREKVKKLELAVEQMKKNAESSGKKVDLTDLVAAHYSRIEGLRDRVKTQRAPTDEKTVITAPVSGKVIRISRFTGERVAAGEPLMELVEDGSVYPVLYLQQNQVAELKKGSHVKVLIEPYSRLVTCTVKQIGNEFEEIPDGLKGKITQQANVVSVKLSPDDPDVARDLLRLGSVIELPRKFSIFSLFREDHNTSTQRGKPEGPGREPSEVD